MRLAMTRRQSDPGAACERIGMWRALSAQVRQKDQPFTSGRHLTSVVNQLRKTLIARELVAIPLQAARGAEHHSHQMPATCNRVTERVQPSFRFDQRRLSRCKNLSLIHIS